MTEPSTFLPKVLLVEDTLSLAATYQAYLRDEDCEVTHVDTGKDALKVVENNAPDVLLLDLMLPDMDGLDILARINERKLPTSVVVVTAHGSVKTAVDAMRLGAFDFLVKPFKAERLVVTVRNALEYRRLRRIVQTLEDSDRHSYCGFIGASLPMRAVYRVIDSAAASKATVFITGESGTGKEVCAEAIHKQGTRTDKPFIAINCGAIPKDLMESEIFGHVKGSFTGAIADREGAARSADGGTLFLDEICEMDLSLQTKLLRFVQTGTFQKVGSSDMETTDIRFVCATNRDPFEEVAEGRFREDLFYRLHVIPIVLPPLHERGDDVLDIAHKFLADIAVEEGKKFEKFSPETEAVFRTYAWPGNIRQLQNAIRNMVVLNDAREITVDMLPPPLDQYAKEGAMPTPPSRASGRQQVSPRTGPGMGPGRGGRQPRNGPGSGQGPIRPLVEVEKETIVDAISRCGGNIPKAAASLGISPSTIYRKRAGWEGKTAT